MLPTGGGKTVCFSYMTYEAAKRRKLALLMVHRKELVDQISQSLTSFNVRHGIIAAGYPSQAAQVQVANVHTLVRRLDNPAFRAWLGKVDLVVIDEAHHRGAETWNQVLAHTPRATEVGVTATPVRLDGKGLARYFDSMVVGPSVAELVDLGYLVEPVLYEPRGVDMTGVRTIRGDFDKVQASQRMDRAEIHGGLVEHYLKLCRGKKMIVFCVSILHAEHVLAAYLAAGVPAVLIHGKQERAVRKAQEQQFSRGDALILVSVDLVGEGYDVPECEAVQLARPTQSLGLYLQQCGRALRPMPGKDRAIILDHVGNQRRHGMPDDDRQWVLGYDRGTRDAGAGEKPMALRTCGECYAINRGTAAVCEQCGVGFPVAVREIREVEGELVEHRRERKPPVDPVRRDELLAGCRSLHDFHQVAKELGYKSGWAFRQYQNRAVGV